MNVNISYELIFSAVYQSVNYIRSVAKLTYTQGVHVKYIQSVTARYRLKYCLKGPLNPKPTNQPFSQ